MFRSSSAPFFDFADMIRSKLLVFPLAEASLNSRNHSLIVARCCSRSDLGWSLDGSPVGVDVAEELEPLDEPAGLGSLNLGFGFSSEQPLSTVSVNRHTNSTVNGRLEPVIVASPE